jgi:folate-binding protein YgfZ
LLGLPGAVDSDPPDGGVAAHYGSPMQEQRRLAAGEGFVDLSQRDVFTVRGADRLAWLHSLCTQVFEGLAPGEPVDALVLSPQGRIEHAFSGIDDGETLWAHTEPGAATALVGFLDRMRFMMRVDVQPETDTAVVGFGDGHFRFVERAQLVGLPAEDGEPAGLWAHEALRIAAGRVRIGLDTDDRTVPNEIDLYGTVLDKGCYRGQETVARVHNLGRPPRRLVRLHLDGSVDRLPPVGAEVSVDGTSVGVMGTSARHHEWGPIGLAMIKRNVDVTAALVVDGVAAGQDVIVDPEVGLHVRPKGAAGG